MLMSYMIVCVSTSGYTHTIFWKYSAEDSLVRQSSSLLELLFCSCCLLLHPSGFVCVNFSCKHLTSVLYSELR